MPTDSEGFPEDPAEWLASLGEHEEDRNPVVGSVRDELAPVARRIQEEFSGLVVFSGPLLHAENHPTVITSGPDAATLVEHIQLARGLGVRVLYVNAQVFSQFEQQQNVLVQTQSADTVESISVSFMFEGVIHTALVRHSVSTAYLERSASGSGKELDREETYELARTALVSGGVRLGDYERQRDLRELLDSEHPDLSRRARQLVISRVEELSQDDEFVASLHSVDLERAKKVLAEAETDPSFDPTDWSAGRDLLDRIDTPGRTNAALHLLLDDIRETYAVTWDTSTYPIHPLVEQARSLARSDPFNLASGPEEEELAVIHAFPDLVRWQINVLATLARRVYATEIIDEVREELREDIEAVVRSSAYERACFKRTIRARDEVAEQMLCHHATWKREIGALTAREDFERTRRSIVERKYGDFSRIAHGRGATRKAVAQFSGISTGVLTRLEDQTTDLKPSAEGIALYRDFAIAELTGTGMNADAAAEFVNDALSSISET